jgi:hypothetical protein
MRCQTSRAWRFLSASLAVKMFCFFHWNRKLLTAKNAENSRKARRENQVGRRLLSPGNLQRAVQADLQRRAFLQLQTPVAEQGSDDSCCSANVGASASITLPPATS